MHSRIAILMAADMVGYSAMMSSDQNAAIAAVRALKSQDLEPIVLERGGEILKRMGDGWIIAFSSVGAAVASAMEVQNGLSNHPTTKLRIGCHIGEIVEDEDDFYGAGVNIAQRIQTEAPPGGLMISEDLYRQLEDSGRMELKDAGTFRLKNISQAVRLYQWRPSPSLTNRNGDVPSIVVQPFQYAPSNDDTGAVAGDLHDELIVRLSRRKGVLIFDGLSQNSDQGIYDLRGRLRLGSGKGRFTLALTLRSEGRAVWSRTYDAPADDVFAFCDDILERVEGDLRLQTNAFDGDRLSGIPDNELSVSELRAKAANEFYKVTTGSWALGLELMERAIQLNPLDGVALAMRVEAQVMLYGARYEVMPETLKMSLLDDLNEAVIQTPLSDYIFWVRALHRLSAIDDVRGARADLRRSAEINPAYRELHEIEGQICLREGHFQEADAAYTRLIDRGAQDPLQPYRLFQRGVARYCARNFEGAERDAARGFDLRPNEAGHLKLRALALTALNANSDAQACLERSRKLSSDPTITTKLPVLPDGFEWMHDTLKPGA